MKNTLFVLVILLFTRSFVAEAALASGPTAPSRSDLVQWTMGLGLVIVLILLLALLLRRMNQCAFSQGKRLRILGGIPVGARERVVLLQVGERCLLLGVAPGRVETLHVLQPGELAGAEEGKREDLAPATFADQIRQAMRGR
jgi:flagellar protein FliO/FliZ